MNDAAAKAAVKEPAPRADVALDVARLERDLRERIAGEVRFDEGSRALYAADASNYRQVPIGVVVPKTVEDVIATVAVARTHGAPILSRGGEFLLGLNQLALCGQLAFGLASRHRRGQPIGVDCIAAFDAG